MSKTRHDARTRAERITSILYAADGPMTAGELAEAMGEPYYHIEKYLRERMLVRGLVVRVPTSDATVGGNTPRWLWTTVRSGGGGS